MFVTIVTWMNLGNSLEHLCWILLTITTTADLYLDAVGFVADGKFEFAKASQLPAIIANEHQELVNGKELMKKETAECRKLQMHYCEVISHAVI